MTQFILKKNAGSCDSKKRSHNCKNICMLGVVHKTWKKDMPDHGVFWGVVQRVLWWVLFMMVIVYLQMKG